MDENNIIHGDLKLENILYKIRDDNKLLYKLTDIGGNVEFLELTENFLDKSQPEFTAPEVLSDNKLQSLSDLWSLGIIIYMLFFRKKPYESNRKALVLESIKLNGQNSFSSSNNPDFDHLIRKLLTVNLKERLTWQQYFSHPFLVGGDCWKYYKDKKEIGKGPYYTVFSVKIPDREESRAVKAIDIKKIKRGIGNKNLRSCTDEDLKPYINDFIKETKNMELLLGNNNDKNAVIFYEYFQTKDEFCIVQELCDCSLNALSIKKRTFTVQEIYQILTQLNNPFGILHKNNISHKDLRLEKILIKKNEKGENIYKLTGLEFNRKVNELLINIITTHDKYNAPEILRGEIAKKSE
jgi:serine/threonine protein kinase